MFSQTITSESTTKNYQDLLTMQKSKRGDFWFLLSILIPLSISPVTISYDGGQSSLMVIQWLLFTLDVSHFRFIINLSIYPVDFFGLQLPIPFISNNGNPLYMLFVTIQIIALFCAIVLRIKQSLDKRNGKVINSGSVGLAAFVIVFFEILKFFVSPFQLIALFQNSQGLSWQTTGITIQDHVVTAIMTFINNLFGQTNVYATTNMIPILPLPIISNFLKIIGITIVYPITFYLNILTYPIGLIFPIIWMNQERKAFPPAFSSWVSNFLRALVIIVFSIISLFPVVWLIFISINYNDVLKSGNVIWPFNGLPASNGFSDEAWLAFDHFQFFNSNFTIPFLNLTIDKSAVAFAFIIFSGVFLLLGIIIVYKRKTFSNFFNNWLGDQFQEITRKLSWFSLIIFELLLLIVLRVALTNMRSSLAYDSTNSSSYVQILKFLIDYLVVGLGNLLLINLLLPLLIAIILISFIIGIFTHKKQWFLLHKAKSFENAFSIIFFVIFCYFIIAAFYLNIISSGLGGIYYSGFNSFSNIFWYDVGFILMSIVFLSVIFSTPIHIHKKDTNTEVKKNSNQNWYFYPISKVTLAFILLYYTFKRFFFRKMSWYSWFEGFFYEDGLAYLLTAASFVLGTYFAILADQAMNWIYIQSNTHANYTVGNWFFITFYICSIVSILSIAVASFAGYALSRFNFQGRKLMGTMILSTQIFPGVLLVLPIFIMLSAMGLTRSLVGLGVAYIIMSLPFITFLLKGFFDSIPKDLEEQAMIDGCSRFQAYYKIVLPLIKPGIMSTFVFSFLALYTEYLFALTVYSPPDRSQYTIALAMLNIFQADITQRGVYYNEMAVFAIFVTIPVLLIFGYLQKYFVQGLVSGSVK